MANIFRPTHPQQPVACLFLVENSAKMFPKWADLKDQYLFKLVDALASYSVPVTLSVLESIPCQDPASNASLRQPYSDYYRGLQDVRFDYAGENRLSLRIITNAVNYLLSGKFQGQQPDRHLIIVAASPLISESSDGYGYHAWYNLAQTMAQNKIYCHIVVPPNEEMTALNVLWNQTRLMQGHIEANLPFMVDSQLALFHLSASPAFEPYSGSSAERSYPQAPAMPRRNSYPLDNFYHEPQESQYQGHAEPEPAPSLVSQLQQVHGLTKKKLYTAKPVRSPFFRDEPARDKYHHAPAPLTLPSHAPESIPSPTSGGRVMTQSRVDRMNRLSHSSPTDQHGRRPFPFARRGSRLSTPEADNLRVAPSDVSPGSSYVSSDYSSPITPVHAAEDLYGAHGAVPRHSPPVTVHTSPLASYQTTTLNDTIWSAEPQYPGGYSAQSQSYFPPQQTFYDSAGSAADGLSLSQHQPPSSMPESPKAYGSPSTVTTPGAVGVPLLGKPSPPRPSKKPPSEEDEERFTFGEEYVAATAALFDEEVLPSYPDFPGSSPGLASRNHDILSKVTLAETGNLYALRPRARVSLPVAPSAPMVVSNHYQAASIHNAPSYYDYPAESYQQSHHHFSSPHYLPAGGSSLTGWAG